MDIGESVEGRRPYGLAERVKQIQPSAILVDQTAYRYPPDKENAMEIFCKVYSKFQVEMLPQRLKRLLQEI